MHWLAWSLLTLAVFSKLRHPAAWPAILFGGVFTLLGTFGDEIWHWSAENNGAGLPSDVQGDPTQNVAFLWAALGSLIFCVSMPRSWRQERSDIPRIASSSWPRYQRLSLRASSFVYLVWLVGQGPSFFDRQIYAMTDGVDFIVRLTGFIGPVLGLAALVIGIIGEATNWQRVLQMSVGLVWFASGIAVGTRMAVAFPLALMFVLLSRLWHRTAFFSGLGLILGVYLCAHGTLAAFAMSLTVRGQPHGLLQLGALVQDERIPRLLDPAHWITAVQLLVSSITASVPITELSVARAPSAALLLSNANPLPSQLLNLNTFDQERLWPFAWIPLSMVGEWYGATGPAGQMALFFGIALLAAFGVKVGTESRNPIIVAVVIGLSAMVLAMSIQYPSRSFWRGVSLLVLVALVSFGLARSKGRPSHTRQAAGQSVTGGNFGRKERSVSIGTSREDPPDSGATVLSGVSLRAMHAESGQSRHFS